jgi:2'-5' RNA ligase superfamily
VSGHRWRHSWDDPFDTGLVVVVPDATECVGPVRDAFDPYARIGVPPHVTVLYPFVPPELISDAVVDEVADVVGRFASFDFELTNVAEFVGEAFYLAPDPAEPFAAITQALWDRFPDHPPYGGRIETVVPHLTVAGVPFGATRGTVESLLGTDLPIAARARGVTIMIESEDGWTVGPELAFQEGPTAS